MSENYKFFSNDKCEYFPCHKVNNPENFNCLFCYCPLYTLKENCGGNFKYTSNGIKDCSSCLIPHNKNSHDYIMSKINDILNLGKK
ncbi:MAG: cysteine-rich small domain-containing protein [Paraclostridium sordellii]